MSIFNIKNLVLSLAFIQCTAVQSETFTSQFESEKSTYADTHDVVSDTAIAESSSQQKQECGQIKTGFRLTDAHHDGATDSLRSVVVVESINGITVENPLAKKYLKIPAGYHRLKVHRRIHHSDQNRPESKEFLIHIQPDTTYSLAYINDTLISKFNRQNNIDFPVVWHEQQQQCEMLTNQFKSEKSQQIANQLQRAINDKLQQIIALEVAAGGDAREINYALLQESQSSHERFGAVFSPHTHGLVLSVTPNSPASNLGLKSGDVIVNVNNLSLEKSNVNALIEKHYLDNNHTISIKVSRDNRSQYLSGELSTLVTPAWTLSVDNINQDKLLTSNVDQQESDGQCGRIVVGKFMPREEGDINQRNAVFIREIDGVKQRLRGSGQGSVIGLTSVSTSGPNKTRFKLKAGQHRILVSPRSAYLQGENPRDYTYIRFSDEREFSINIEANTTYYLVYDTRISSEYSKTNIPVVWQTKSQECQL